MCHSVKARFCACGSVCWLVGQRVAPAQKQSPSESTTAGTRSEMSLVASIDTDPDAMMLKIRRQTTRLLTKMFASGLSGQHLDREIEACTLRRCDKIKDSCWDRDEFALAFHDTGLILTTRSVIKCLPRLIGMAIAL